MLNMEQNSKFILWNKNRKMDFSSTRMKEVHSLPFLSSFYLTSAPDIPPWAWREKVKLWIALSITYIFLLCSVLLTPSVFLVLLLQHKSWAPDPPAPLFCLIHLLSLTICFLLANSQCSSLKPAAPFSNVRLGQKNLTLSKTLHNIALPEHEK